MTDHIPLVVTELISEIYYKGLPSKPRLIATTRPGPYKFPTGPEAYSVLKELRELGDHPLASAWDHGLADRLRSDLNEMCVNWTSIDALRIVEVKKSSELAIVWIGVEFGALSFEEGSTVASKCRTYVDNYGITDYHVEIRESRVTRQAGIRFLDPVDWSDPTFSARDPYTATLGIPISTKDRPWAEGTGGFYLSAGGEDKEVYLVTARHVVLPLDEDDNKEYERNDDSNARAEVVVLGTPAFNEKLADIDYEIRSQRFDAIEAQERIESVKDVNDPKRARELRNAEYSLEEATEGVEELTALRHDIATHWEAIEERVLGELAWAPPIVLSTEPGEYTLDLAVIKIDDGVLDAQTYHGNTINIGDKYTRKQIKKMIYPHPTSTILFNIPPNRLMTLKDQVPESALTNVPTLDPASEPCLVVFKNGAKTGTTFGKANNVSSYTRTYFGGKYQESREWPVISTQENLGAFSGAFSTKGDSGACVADTSNHIGGIITGGCGATDSTDVTYVTPISFIMKVFHNTERFKNAHLNPVLS